MKFTKMYLYVEIIYVKLSLIFVGALPTFSCFTEDQLSFGISHINCIGPEQHIDNCTHSNPLLHDCTTHKDAGVICQGMEYGIASNVRY